MPITTVFVADQILPASQLNEAFAQAAASADLASNVGAALIGTNTGQTVQQILSTLAQAASVWGGSAGGTANALTFSPTPAMTSYSPGQSLRFRATLTNTGAVTANWSGLGPLPVLGPSGNPLIAGDIIAGDDYTQAYDPISNSLVQYSASALGGPDGASQIGTSDSYVNAQASLNARAVDTAVVHLAGPETITGIKTFSVPPVFSSLTASTALVLDGSKNVASLTYTPVNAGSSIASRDSNGNTAFNAVNGTVTTVVTAAQTVFMNAGSAQHQYFTGTSTATFNLPDATTMYSGAHFYFNNNSTGSITINKHDGTTLVGTAVAGSKGVAIVTDNSTTNGSWDIHWLLQSSAVAGTAGLAITGTLSATGTVTGSNLSGTNTGDLSLAAVGSTANANGASLSGQVLNLQPASASFAGVVKPDGTTIIVTGGGAIAVPTATTGVFGLVKPDGTTITISGGVISASSSGGRLLAVQVFTGNGTYTPTSGANSAIVEMVGGGGAGGPSQATGPSVGGGGNSGGYCKFRWTSLSSQSVTIGTGGVGSSSTPGAGTSTIFGTIATCGGGAAGTAGNAGATPKMSAGSTSLATVPSSITNGTILSTVATKGVPGYGIASNQLISGDGGSTPLGGGGPGIYITASTSNAGNAGIGYGSGAGGSTAGASSPVTTNGQNGVVIVYEYA